MKQKGSASLDEILVFLEKIKRVEEENVFLSKRNYDLSHDKGLLVKRIKKLEKIEKAAKQVAEWKPRGISAVIDELHDALKDAK